MKGFYINQGSSGKVSPDHDIRKIESHTCADIEVRLKRDERCFYSCKGSNSELYVIGSFVIGEKYADVEALKKIIDEKGVSEAYKVLEYGCFTAVYSNIDTGQAFMFTDPLALGACFYTKKEGGLIIALPSVNEFSAEIDADVKAFIDLHGHSIGKYTEKRNVYRLMPFEYIDLVKGDVIHFTKWKRNKNGINDILSDLEKLKKSLSEKKVASSLSSGFDSRFIAYFFSPSMTYCWGPESSRDVVVSKLVSKDIDSQHLSFSLPKHTKDFDRYLYSQYCCGNAKQNKSIISGYRIAHSITKKADVCLDGFLGDVFQRGTYFFGKGIYYELTKIFPTLYLNSDSFLLRRRYPKVYKNKKMYDFLTKVYNDFLDLYGLGETVKSVVLFEYLWGRGIRLIATGGVGVNTHYNSVIAPLASPRIVSYIAECTPKYLYRLYLFKDLWRRMDFKYSSLGECSEHLFTPKTNRLMIYPISLLGRILLNYTPFIKNYSK